jgi:RHS repeat-associated protein
VRNLVEQMTDPLLRVHSFSPVWDAGDRITEEEIVLGQQTQERNYTYDDDDQLLSAELPSGTYSYTYDERYNRLSQRIETLSTDTTDEYTYNEADQLVERVRKDTTTQTILEEESFSYNEVGELISRTLSIGQTDATTQYVYEVGGKLKQVTLPDSSTVTYAYDALGHRIRKLSSSLDIHYQYSQGACRREIHKDPATQNTLRTITYHPWGMNISANQTSTDYYFITDFRGWVWGLTDDSGTIVESYNYDPFGKILAGSLLSHARFLSGAHEGQWDGDTGLYYLGARFYDPSLGRFIQEDAIEGSADHPASQNRYVYCQNDPVALIDPTGYSPENTGTPARYTLLNIGNYTAETSACYLPDVTIFSMNSSGINPIHEGDPMPIPEPPTSDINSPEACSSGSGGGSGQEATKWELRNQHGQIIAEDKGDGSGPVFYEIDKEGNLIDPVGNIIDKNDKDYERNRVALENVSDIEKWFDNLSNAFQKGGMSNFSGEAYNKKGEQIDFLLAFMRANESFVGFSINKKGKARVHDTKTDALWNPIKDLFKNAPDNEPLTPGTILYFERLKINPSSDHSYDWDVKITRYDFVEGKYMRYWLNLIFRWKHNSALFY